MNDHYVVIGSEKCGWCEKAKMLLTENGKSYHYFDIRENIQIRDFLIQNGMDTIPQIYTDGELVGGYDDLKHYLEDK